MQTSSFGLILYFGTKCHLHTKSLSSKTVTSSSRFSLQSQLFYALVFQTIIPVFLMHIPSTISMCAAFTNISIEFISQILSCTISLYPALDPLPNFFIIKSYRNAITQYLTDFLRLLTCGKKHLNVIHVQSRNTSKIWDYLQPKFCSV